MNAIEIEGVRRVFGRVVAVDHLDLVIPQGQFCGLIGHNGAGKSTMLRMLMGLLPPSTGKIRVDGTDVFEDPLTARKKMGAVPEESAVYDELTAQEFLEFVAEVRGGGDVAAALALTGLGADAQRLIREYSQGMKRKTALAAALLGAPPVLVLDEALNGLDPPSASVVKRALRSYVDAGRTVVLSTHVVETLEAVADRVVMLAHGRVVADVMTKDLPAGGLEQLFITTLQQTRDQR